VGEVADVRDGTLGIIEQWGNGLRLIAEELRKYPDLMVFVQLIFGFLEQNKDMTKITYTIFKKI